MNIFDVTKGTNINYLDAIKLFLEGNEKINFKKELIKMKFLGLNFILKYKCRNWNRVKMKILSKSFTEYILFKL